jgi:hypothetical protein
MPVCLWLYKGVRKCKLISETQEFTFADSGGNRRWGMAIAMVTSAVWIYEPSKFDLDNVRDLVRIQN